MVRLLYGIYLLDAGRPTEAVKHFDHAAELATDNADIHYNLGLMYLRVNERQKANFHATQAYDQGHPLPGLRNKMIAAGLWTE
jgi:Flp pilus assembly protein TadD